MLQWTIIIGALATGTALAAGLIVRDIVKAKGKKIINSISRNKTRRH